VAPGSPGRNHHRRPLPPLAAGSRFERYYGFLGGDTDQYFPDLTYDNHPVPVPKTPEEGYHLNIDLADKAIEFIQDAHVNAPEKPFFLYYATGAGHAPHHVEPEWIEKYKGKFDMGWDEYRKIVFERQKEMGILPAGAELSAHDPDVPEWDTLSDDAKKMYARQMEVYAAFFEQTDYHFGRIIELSGKTRRAGQHLSLCHLRQWGQRRRRRPRHLQRGLIL
jgi:arylsulfatase A-like enzyme